MRKLALLLPLILCGVCHLGQAQTGSKVAASGSVETSQRNTEVSLTVTVMNKERYVSDLPRSAFSVKEGNDPLEIISFTSGDEPASVAILFDVPRSTDVRSFQETGKASVLIEALSSFIDLSNSTNDYVLIGFKGEPRLVVDWTSDKARILKGLSEVPAKGYSTLYDALPMAVEKLGERRHRKQVILSVGAYDSISSISRHGRKDILRLLQQSGVLIYAVAILNYSLIFRVGSNVGLASSLNELASITGGVMFPPRTKSELFKFIQQSALELRSQYRLTLKPASISGDDKWHKLNIRVTPPQKTRKELGDLKVRSRQGYFLPKAQK